MLRRVIALNVEYKTNLTCFTLMSKTSKCLFKGTNWVLVFIDLYSSLIHKGFETVYNKTSNYKMKQ